MSPRRWVLKWLMKGSAEPVDPDEFIEVEIVPSYMGPLVETVLRDNDIEPRCEDTYNIVTRALSDVRVLVSRRDFVQATELLTALRQH
ncbi:MAG: hypothetical protein E6G39_09895 [Actinobacteria bacterium]|nr:MAG: hypothetical protein E6G39_09895 [Actinomycetota bacterium]